MNSETPIRDTLLGLEPLSPVMRQRFEQQMRDIVDGKPTRGARTYWVLSLAGDIILAALFGYNLRVAPLRGPLLWGIALCFGLSVVTGSFVLHILVRGRVNARVQIAAGKLLPAIGLAMVFLAFVYGMADPRQPDASFFAIFALAVLVLTSSINLWKRIAAADYHAQKHALRLEYRLAEMASHLPPSGTALGGLGGTSPA